MTRSITAIAWCLALAVGACPAVSIEAIYLAQTHVQKPSAPFFGLVGNRDALDLHAANIVGTLILKNSGLLTVFKKAIIPLADIGISTRIVDERFREKSIARYVCHDGHPILKIAGRQDVIEEPARPHE